MITVIKYKSNNTSDEIRAVSKVMSYYYTSFNNKQLPIVIMSIETNLMFKLVCDNYKIMNKNILSIQICDLICDEIIICDTKTEVLNFLNKTERKEKLNQLNQH